MGFDNLSKVFKEAKLLIATIALVITSVTGSYHFASKYFVTTAYAQELIIEVKQELSELKEQTKYLQEFALEQKLIRIENKIEKGHTLTPTEIRQYEKLKQLYNGE